MFNFNRTFTLIVPSNNAHTQTNSQVSHEDWEKAFKMIELENNLANHRITALLTLQGFLFTVFLLGVKTLIELKEATEDHVFVMLFVLGIVCIVGMASAYVMFFGIYAAYQQVQASAKWLNGIKDALTPVARQEYKKVQPYPLIIGADNRIGILKGMPGIKKLKVGIIWVPLLLVPTWIAFLGLIICSGTYHIFTH